MTLALLAIGLISLLAQVVLLREQSVAFFGSELVYVLAFGVWLLGTAAGALATRRARSSQRTPPSATAIARLFLAAGILIPLSILWSRGARLLLGATPGAYLPFPKQMLAMAAALLPVSFLSGLLFEWTARRAISLKRTLAGAYALESAGALAGGAAATLMLRAGLSNLAAGLLCALAASLAAAMVRSRGLPATEGLARMQNAARERANLPAILWSIVLVAALITAARLDRITTAWTHPGLLETRDSPYGKVTLTDWGGQINVFVNDALAYETGGTAAEEFVHLVALEHPAPRRILILGGGAAGLVREALQHRPETIDSVELDPVLEALLVRHLPPELRAPLAAPGVRTVIGDPRRFLRDEAGDEAAAGGHAFTGGAEGDGRYDLILVGMPEPSSGQTNRFYTRDFFAACAARLAPGGILALRLPSAENFWTPQLVRRTASIDRALRAVFGDVLLVPGTTSVVMASAAPLAREAAPLRARFAERALRTRLVTPAYLEYLLTNDRVAQVAGALSAARVPVNTDARPVCYQYTLMLWLAKFYPRVAWMDPRALLDGSRPGDVEAPAAASGVGGAGWPARLVAVAGVAALALARWATRRPSWRRVVIVGVAGCAGMLVESLLLLAYQARQGVLYQDLGLLLTLFMGGLAAGAWTMDRAARAADGRATAGGSVSKRAAIDRALGAALLLGLAVLTALLAARLGGRGGPGLAETGAWLFAAGLSTAAIFAHAARCATDQSAAVGPLYGADLIGGCVGSLAGSLIVIPLAGLGSGALGISGLALAALLWI